MVNRDNPPGAENGKDERRFPIVGIGASAGGLEALQEFFAGMPADAGFAFVVVTHQPPGRTSLLPEILARTTSMAVLEAAEGIKVEPDHVYVSPAGSELAIAEGALHLSAPARQIPSLPHRPLLPLAVFRSEGAGGRRRALRDRQRRDAGRARDQGRIRDGDGAG